MAVIATINATSTEMASSIDVTSYFDTTTPAGGELTFVFAVMESIRWCTTLTRHLALVLKLSIIAQAMVSLPSLVGATLTFWGSKCPLSYEVGLLSITDLLFVCSVLLPSYGNTWSSLDEIVIAAFQVQRQVALWIVSSTLLSTYKRKDEPSSGTNCPSPKPFSIRKISRAGFAITKVGIVVTAGVAFIFPFLHYYVYGFVSVEGVECGQNRWLAPYGLPQTVYAAFILFVFLPLFVVLITNVVLIRTLRYVGDRLNGGLLNSNVSSIADKKAYAKQVLVSFRIMKVWHGVSIIPPSFVFFVLFMGINLSSLSATGQVALAVFMDAVFVFGAAANLMFSFIVWHHFLCPCLAFWHSKCGGADDGFDERSESPYDKDVWDVQKL